MKLDKDVLQFIGISILSLLNFAVLLWQTVKRTPREVEKMNAEKTESYAEAAESNMQGAKISNELLVERINELKGYIRKATVRIEYLEKLLRERGIKFEDFSLLDSNPKIEVVKK